MNKDIKDSSLDIALENMKGFVKRGSEIGEPEFIPTGHFELDLAIGHGVPPGTTDIDSYKFDPKRPGGMPLGRLVELFGLEASGKSSLAYRVVGKAQKLGYGCLWIDTEHSFSKSLAEINGINTNDLYMSDLVDTDDPEKVYVAEDIMENICVACQGGFKVIVLDSVANLITKAEMENALGEGGVGMANLAQLMSKAVKKVCNYAAKHNACIIMINQLREKIGVMFGCFHGETLVSFADGSRIPIKTVVDKKLKGPVLSYNEATQKIESAEIVNWFNNGNLNKESGEKWLQFITSGPGTLNGRLGFVCTPNHILFRANGTEVSAEEVQVGDTLMSYYERQVLLDEVHRDVIFGSLLGDGTIRVRDTDSGAFSLANQEQPEYLQWKISHLPMLHMRSSGNDYRPRYDSEYSVEMKTLKDMFYKDGRGYRQIPDNIKLTPRMLAVWYMDDGWMHHDSINISIKRLSGEQIEKAKLLLSEYTTEFSNMVTYQPSNKILYLKTEVSDIFFSHIAPYVPKCMQHKLPPQYQNKYVEVEAQIAEVELRPYAATVIDVDEASPRKYRSTKKYDLQIANNSNYVVGGGSGIVVHNSPESTPGGRALKFNASLRLRMQKQSSKDGQVIVENDDGKQHTVAGRSYVQVVKNRFAPPIYESVNIPIYYKCYFPDIEEILFDAGRQTKVISVRKGVFSWDDVKIEGRKNFIAEIKSKNLTDKLVVEIKSAAKIEGILVPPEVTQYDLQEKPNSQEVTTDADTEVSGHRKAKNSKSGKAGSVE